MNGIHCKCNLIEVDKTLALALGCGVMGYVASRVEYIPNIASDLFKAMWVLFRNRLVLITLSTRGN